MKKLIVAVFLAAFLGFPNLSLAKIGVGVGTGKINVDEILHPGTIYKLPAITVINTGDETADYEVVVSHRETQPELKPSQKWISYSPDSFSLDAGEVQVVNVTLNLPVKTQPGDYFAFLEAHPVKKDHAGSSSVSVAAASKLYFSVEPTNLISGIYYKVISWWRLSAPWSNIVSGLIVLTIIIVTGRRFVDVNVKLKPKGKEEQQDEG